MSDEFKSIAQIEKAERMQAKKNRGPLLSADMSELIKNTLIMLIITLVAGGILGFVYEITKEPIAIMEQKVKDDANREVFMLASSFSDSIIDEYPVTDEWKAAFGGVDITDAIMAYDSDNQLMGFVIEVTSHEGYGGDIVFRIGIDTTGNINAISITSISETAGLGMRAEEVLVPQFRNRNETSFEVVKGGTVMDNQIDAISSATITSKAVTNGVNGALEYFRNVLMGGVQNE